MLEQAALIDQCCENIADICATYHKEKADDPAAWYSPQFQDNYFAEM